MYLREYEHLTSSVQEVTQNIQSLSKQAAYQEEVKLLSSAPGIGTLSAMEFLMEIGDIHRFENGDQLAAYVGLTPSPYSSGEHTRLGRITKSGKSHLRATLIEASWTAISKDEDLRKKFERVKQKAGAKRAIVAIARHLVTRLRLLLIKRETYRLTPAV